MAVRCALVFATLLLIFPRVSECAEPLREIPAPEASQGVAVDARHVYAIGNRVVAKYDKFTGARIKVWSASDEYPLAHLNSGMVHDGRLICAHSNYGALPMVSSVEIWDTETLEHVGNHSFGIAYGSLTWFDRYNGHWWACFVHYNNKSGYPDKDNRHSLVVKLDDAWQPMESWVFPDELLVRFGDYSASGGSWGSDGLLYCAGHDNAEVYALALPKAGSTLRLVKTIPFPIAGQAIAFDRGGTGLLYGIVRAKKTIVAALLPKDGE